MRYLICNLLLLMAVAELSDAQTEVSIEASNCTGCPVTVELDAGEYELTILSGAVSFWSSDSDYHCEDTGCWLTWVYVSVPATGQLVRFGAPDLYFTYEEAEAASIGRSATIIVPDQSTTVLLMVENQACSYCNDNRGGPIRISISEARPAQWTVASGGNGHFYEVISGSFTWDAAYELASQRTWNGHQGHLVTITSAEEDLWLCTYLEMDRGWLGGVQIDESDEPAGGWIWITGEPWEYENWDVGEPNNDHGGTETRLMGRDNCTWNDSRPVTPSAARIIVEYGTEGNAASFLVSATVHGSGSGEPVEAARVIVFQNGVAVKDAYTDASGVCSLAPPWFGQDRYHVLRVDLGMGRVADSDLGYVEAGSIHQRSIHIPVYIEMSGRVRDSCNQRGISQAQVTIFDDNDLPVATAVTGNDGSFRCDVQDPGSYYFAATKLGQVGTIPDTALYKAAESALTVVPSGSYFANLGVLEVETNVVVLVHGIKSSAENWGENGYPEALRSAGWAVIDDIDLPGTLLDWHGFDRIKTQAVTLKGMIDPLGVQSVNIVAHSQGGLVSRYMNENLAPTGGMVNKLIALATPHHGSPLATSVIGVREWLLKNVPGYEAYTLLELVGAVDPLLPAVDDLAPNSEFLKELNQRNAGFFTNDWVGDCWLDFGSPNTEKGLVPNTKYVTIRGEGWGDWHYYITGSVMATTSRCADSDGVVPTESAMLYADGPNVYNYTAGDLIHHKVTTVGIVEDEWIRSRVLLFLGTDPSTWPDESKSTTEPVADVPEGQGFIAYRELIVPPAGATEDSVAVDSCDLLEIAWSWFEGDVDLILESPSGTVIDSLFAATDPSINLDLDHAEMSGRYQIQFPEPGRWILAAESSNSTIEQNIVPLISSVGAIGMRVTTSRAADEAFADRLVQAELQSLEGVPVVGANVVLDWLGPSGASGQLGLLDDGNAPDVTAGDGTYTGQFSVESQAGTTTLEIAASGTDPSVFTRNSLLSIIESAVFDVAVTESGLNATSNNNLALSPISLQASIENSGSSDAYVTVRFHTSEGLTLQESVAVVPAQGFSEFTAAHLPLAEGVYEYGLQVLATGNYADADLANNISTTSIVISPAVTAVQDVGDSEHSYPEVPGRRNTAILAAYPNPFNPSIRLQFAHMRAGETKVQIFDARGRHVRTLFSGHKAKGAFQLGWDGHDESGQGVSAGLYIVYFKSGAVEDTRKVMLLK